MPYTSLLQFIDFFKDREWRVDFANLYRRGIPLNDNSLAIVRK